MYHKGNDSKPKGFGFTGFSLQGAGAPGPRKTGPETQLAQMGYGVLGMGVGGRSGYGHMSTGIGKRRIKSEEEYFEDDEEQNVEDLEYQPAPDSPVLQRKEKSDSDSDDEADPLDAFMAGIEKEVTKQQRGPACAPGTSGSSKQEEEEKDKGVRGDIEEEDAEESYYRYMEENPTAGLNLEDDELYLEYDADGNAILPDKKYIDPLPSIDHDDIDYAKFNKNFYEEHEEIKQLSYDDVEELRKKLNIRVTGILPPAPVSSFGHFSFDDKLIKTIRKAGYTQPTPIQAQGVPTALAGRDIIGIAKTGSGKTAAFIWPLLVHIMDQPELKPKEGPVGVLCAPTRELSQQIHQEAKKFAKIYNIRAICCYGGGSMWEQIKACEEGAEIIVCTPGRLIDLVKKGATNLRRASFIVFDEADRMFNMGFEPQVRSIANQVRPDRQTLLFSATFKKRIERLARDILTDPIRVVQGDVGEANEDITQIVKVMPVGPMKWNWLTTRLVEFMINGSVLIFVTRKLNSEELANNLQAKDFSLGLLHGDMDQTERNKVITAFKKKEMPILVATDVAARGLDITHIKTVVNFDVARDIDTHTHRIGRTGRAGEKGTAYTLVTDKDKEFAGSLVRNLEGANQDVPRELLELALQNPWFKQNRFKQGKAKRMNVGGKGLGFKERPGLGTPSSGSGASASKGGGGSKGGGEAENFRQYEPSGTAGPQSDRATAMKAAFRAQFKSNFVGANDDWSGTTGTQKYTDPTPESKRRKKSRFSD